MSVSLNIVGFLLPQSSASAFTGLAAGVNSGTQTDPALAIAALRNAQKNEAREVARTLESPQVQRDLRRFIEVVARATTPEQVLDDPIARRVLLTANGLGAQADAVGLAKRALLGDLSDPRNPANQLADTQPGWRATAQTLDFRESGLEVLKDPDTLRSITEAYGQIRWQEDLERRAPGLSFAISFVKDLGKVDSAIKVLGNRVAREVVTGAFGIPRQIALQPLETQEEVIERRVNVSRLPEQSYREEIARRYLISRNAGSLGSGSVANLFA
jgi:Protein of unknown function (DUF1217)